MPDFKNFPGIPEKSKPIISNVEKRLNSNHEILMSEKKEKSDERLSEEAVMALNQNLRIFNASNDLRYWGDPKKFHHLNILRNDVINKLGSFLDIPDFKRIIDPQNQGIQGISKRLSHLPGENFDKRKNQLLEELTPDISNFRSLIEQLPQETSSILVEYYLKRYDELAQYLLPLNLEEKKRKAKTKAELNITGFLPKHIITSASEPFGEVVAESLKFLIKNQNKDSLKIWLEILGNNRDLEVADKVLFAKDLSENERRNFAINYINTFGFITFSRAIQSNQEVPEDLMKFFKEINGVEEENLVMINNVSDFYSFLTTKESFSRNYDPKLVEEEVTLIKRVLEKLGLKLEDSSILDLGAGYGRLSKELVERGAGKVISVEYVFDFVKEMLRGREASGIDRDKWQIERGDWKKLWNLGFRINKPDLGVCVGRSLPHANSMEDLVTVLANMTSSKMPDTWIFDYPDTESGFFAEKTKKYQENLEKMGIDYRAMNLVYDGILNTHRMHRMFASSKQIKDICELLGFNVNYFTSQQETTYSKDVRNNYFIINRKKDFEISKLDSDNLYRIFNELEFFKPGTDLNILLPPPINLSLGQLLILSTKEDSVKSELIEQFKKLNSSGQSKLEWHRGKGEFLVVSEDGGPLGLFATFKKGSPYNEIPEI